MFRMITKWSGLLVLGLLLGPQLNWAQQTAATRTSEDPLQEILSELRAIRQTLDRSLVAQSRLLLRAEQARMAYQTLAVATEHLDGARAQVALTHAGVLQATRTAETLESQLNQTADPDQRAALERQLKEQHSLSAEYQQREAELREEETRLKREFQDAQYNMEHATVSLQAITNQIEQESNSRAATVSGAALK